jgi:exosortase
MNSPLSTSPAALDDNPALPRASGGAVSRSSFWRDPLTAGLLLASAVLLLALGWPALNLWISGAMMPGSYFSYGPVIPFVVALMLWHRRDVLRAAPKAPDYRALFLLLSAVAMLIIGPKEWWIFVISTGFLLAIWSSLWLLLGAAWVRAAAFPLAFLAWMAGMPGPLWQELTFGSQQLSTVLADKMLHLLSFPTVLRGNMITLESFTLFVDLPCSGFKLLLTLLMVSAALLWLCDGPPLGLFALSLPLAIADNVLRLTVLGVVGESFGSHAEKMIHDPSGIFMVGLGIVVLFALARRIGCRTFAGLPLF